jgi:hypothetical protein
MSQNYGVSGLYGIYLTTNSVLEVGYLFVTICATPQNHVTVNQSTTMANVILAPASISIAQSSIRASRSYPAIYENTDHPTHTVSCLLHSGRFAQEVHLLENIQPILKIRQSSTSKRKAKDPCYIPTD